MSESNWKDRLNEEVDILRQTRDELRVQLHLGAAEAQDAWNKVEKNWNHLESHLKQIGRATQDAAEDVEEASKGLVEEIKHGYQKIRDSI